MTVFFNSLKRLFKSKVQIVVLFILPFLPLLPICISNSGSMTTLKIAIVDRDSTQLTRSFEQCLKQKFDVVNIAESNIKDSINNGSINFAIVIPKGYTDGIIGSKDIRMEGYDSSEKSVSAIIKGFTDAYMNPVKNIAAVSSGSGVGFYGGLKAYNNAFYKQLKANTDAGSKDSIVIFGMITMFLMFTPVFAATIIITDKEKKTFYRTLDSGLSLKSYMLQNILSFEAIELLQIAVLLAVTILGFKADPGSSIWYLILLFFIFSLVSVAFGIAVSSICKNTIQAVMTGVGTITFMSLIGGAWGMKPTSGAIDKISKVMPVTWMVDGVQKLLNKEDFSSITQNIIILIIFACIFFLLGTWRKSDITE